MRTLQKILAVSALGLGSLTGCADMTDQEALGLLLGMSAPYSRDARAGQAVSGAGDALVRLSAAERGKSEIIINNGVINGFKKIDSGYSTVFSYWADGANGNPKDGVAQLRELIGASDTISLGESREITFGTSIAGHQGDLMSLYVYRPNATSATYMQENIVINRHNSFVWAKTTSQTLQQAGMEGNCLVNWRVKKQGDTSSGEISDIYHVNFTK